jgi:DNA glycosylase AlkZ-like
MWSARSAFASPAELERELWRERRLVKGWFMRGTLHLLPAADFHLHGAARDFQEPLPSWFKYFEVTAADLDALREVVPEALSAEPMTRRELVDAVGDRLPARVTARLTSSWGEFLKPLARRGLLCFGPPRGGQTTLVLPSAWLGEQPRLEADDAVAELCRRYLRAFAPATRADFQRWAGLEPRRTRVAWTRLHGELAAVLIEGERESCAVLTADLDELAGAEPVTGVRLLGGFDTYLLGHSDRGHLGVPAALRPRVWRQAGWVSPVLLAAGRVAGVWSHEVRRGRVLVAVEPFRTLRRGERRDVETESARLADYLGGEAEVRWAG